MRNMSRTLYLFSPSHKYINIYIKKYHINKAWPNTGTVNGNYLENVFIMDCSDLVNYSLCFFLNQAPSFCDQYATILGLHMKPIHAIHNHETNYCLLRK